jgi:hypothetical protein
MTPWINRVLVFQVHIPALVLSRFVFRKWYATYTLQAVNAILKSYFSVGHEISNFYRNTKVRCWATCACQDPVTSRTHPRINIRFSVIFPFLCYLSSLHKFIYFSPLPCALHSLPIPPSLVNRCGWVKKLNFVNICYIKRQEWSIPQHPSSLT